MVSFWWICVSLFSYLYLSSKRECTMVIDFFKYRNIFKTLFFLYFYSYGLSSVFKRWKGTRRFMYSVWHIHFAFIIKFLCKKNTKYSTISLTPLIQFRGRSISLYTDMLPMYLHSTASQQPFLINHDTSLSIPHLASRSFSPHFIKGWPLCVPSGHFLAKINHKRAG